MTFHLPLMYLAWTSRGPSPAPITDIAGWQVLLDSFILVVAVVPASPPILVLRRAGPEGQGTEMPVIAVYMADRWSFQLSGRRRRT